MLLQGLGKSIGRRPGKPEALGQFRHRELALRSREGDQHRQPPAQALGALCFVHIVDIRLHVDQSTTIWPDAEVGQLAVPQ